MLKRSLAMAAVAGILMFSGVASAQDATMQDLEARVKKLEAGTGTSGNLALGSMLTFGAVIEVESSYTTQDLDSNTENKESDIVLATVELAIAAEISEYADAELILLHEEDDTEPMQVDVGVINLHGKDYTVTLGKQYIPFGEFSSNMVTDPITVDLGETNQTAVTITGGNESLSAAMSISNGEAQKTGEGNHFDDLCLRIDYDPFSDASNSYSMGVSYITDIADTDATHPFRNTSGGDPRISKTVGGLAAYFHWSNNNISFISEYVTATGKFDPADLDANGDGDGDQPWALNLELAQHFENDRTLAIQYQRSEEFNDQPESSVGMTYSFALGKNTGLAFEYLYRKYDGPLSNIDNSHSLTAQVSLEI